jgi:hypothetical protein
VSGLTHSSHSGHKDNGEFVQDNHDEVIGNDGGYQKEKLRVRGEDVKSKTAGAN